MTNLEAWRATSATAARNLATGATGSTTPPASANTLFGFYPGDDTLNAGTTFTQDYNRISGYLGTPGAYRMFYNTTSLLPTNFVGSEADFGPPCVVSFKFAPADVLAGTYDARITSWFNSIPAGRKVWWSYWHEPEDEIRDGVFTSTQYKAAWEHIIALQPANANLRATLILMGYSLFRTDRPLDLYVCNGLKVLSWDSYLTGTTKTIDNVLDLPKSKSAAYGLGFAISETAVAPTYNLSGQTHDQTVTALAQAHRDRAPGLGAEFVTWFESNKSDGDWRMRPYSTAVAAWTA